MEKIKPWYLSSSRKSNFPVLDITTRKAPCLSKRVAGCCYHIRIPSYSFFRKLSRTLFHFSGYSYQLMISGGDVKAVQGTTGHASANLLVNTYAHIQQDSRKKLGKKFEEGFYKPGTTPVQAAPVEAEPTISVSALLELLKDADPSVKAQLRLALLT